MNTARKTKTIITTALIASTAFAVVSLTVGSSAQEATQNAAIAIKPDKPASHPRTRDQRFNLHAQGDRFAKAIALIESEAKKPNWSWEEGDNVQVKRVASGN